MYSIGQNVSSWHRVECAYVCVHACVHVGVCVCVWGGGGGGGGEKGCKLVGSSHQTVQ